MRFGLGPVFACERAIATRRWQTYAARSFLLFALLVAIATVASSRARVFAGSRARDYAALGESYFYAMIGVELALVLLAAPAATAGAICLDRARGTLAHVLATDLSDTEIVLGKLAARLAPILALVACTWPVMAISSLLGGIDPTALTMAFAIIVAVAMLGCSLALVLSVWARRTHEVMLAVYVVWALVLLAWPIWYALALGGVLPAPDRWLLVANPFYLAFAPYSKPGQVSLLEYLGFFFVVAAASVVSILVAVWRVRPVARHSEGKAQRDAGFGWLGRLSRALPGPSLDGNPVLWREWHRLRPSWWMIAIGILIWGTTTATCGVGAYFVWQHGIRQTPGPMAAQLAGLCGSMILILFGLLMLSAIAPTSMSEERQRGSLDVLVATPLTTTSILLGKWWGTFRLVPFLAIGPGLLALALATAPLSRPTSGATFASFDNRSLGARLAAVALVVTTILTYGAALTSLGLALATWISRQNRAIGTSVCIFVLLAIAWPFLVMVGAGRGIAGLPTLSPIASALVLSARLSERSDGLGGTLWWVGLWNVAALATAVGLCWLTLRTFDEAFGRIPERPRTSHWMGDVAIVVAGVSAAACSVNAVAIWIQGVEQRNFGRGVREDDATLFSYISFELLGLVLLSVVAALRAPPPVAQPLMEPGESSARSSAWIVLDCWWRVFRLALLLAVAPGLITLALATAREFRPVVTVQDTRFFGPGTKAVMISVTTPSGESTNRLYRGDRSDASVQAAIRELSAQDPVLPLGDRLRDAGLLMITFLAHAAAATTAGLALAVWIKRRRPRIAASACLPLLVAVAWPIGIYLIFRFRDTMRGVYGLSVVWVAEHLMDPLLGRQPHRSDFLGWIAAWDAAVTLFTIGLLYWAIRSEKSCGSGLKDRIAEDLDLGADVERSLVEV
jgi:ABC-type transport system involved in multi-copper enzyme maturation permease subunit